MEGCICKTNSHWWFYHLSYCPWRLREEAEKRARWCGK